MIQPGKEHNLRLDIQPVSILLAFDYVNYHACLLRSY